MTSLTAPTGIPRHVPQASEADLRSQSMRVRSDSVTVRIELGFTLCRVVETEYLAGEKTLARRVLERVRRQHEFICEHVEMPNFVLPSLLPELRKRLSELENRIRLLDVRIPK